MCLATLAACDDTELSLPDAAATDAGAMADATSADASTPCLDPSACRGDVAITQSEANALAGMSAA